MSEPASNRKLAAVLAADIVGYSRLMQADDQATLATLKEYRAAVGRIIARHAGRVVNTPGDSVLAEFRSAQDAVRAAVDVQHDIEGRNRELAEDRQMHFRIGVNLGDVIEEDDGTLYGDGVNIAARMEALAEGGGICISSTVYDAIAGKLGLGFDFLGEQQVKNIAQPVRVYRVRAEPRTAPAPRLSTRRRRAATIAAAAAAIVVVIGGLAFWQLAPAPTPEPDVVPTAAPDALDKSRIAVLPFAHIGAEGGDEYFADGLTEELISKLSEIRELSVIARTSVMSYKNTDKKIDEIGRELNVGTILEGSVRRAKNMVRITVQLIDVASQAHIWSEDYNREFKDIFLIQSDVAQSVAGMLQVDLSASEETRIAQRDTDSMEAYNLYLQGLYHMNKLTEDGLTKAVDLFEKAVVIDPGYAQAYANLGLANELRGEFLYAPANIAFSESREAAETALRLDEGNALAHGVSATMKIYLDWDWAGARTQFEKVIELNPSDAYGYDAFSIFYLTPNGLHSEAIAAMERAIELDPLAVLYVHDLGWIYYMGGDYPRAADQLRRALQREPDFSNAHRGLGLAYAQMGRFEEAIDEMQRSVELTDGSALATGYLGWVYGLSGRRDQAQELLAQLEERAKSEAFDPTAFAALYTGLGEVDKAVEALTRGNEEGWTYTLVWVKQLPEYDPLRSHSGFIDLLRQIGLEPDA